MSKQTQQLFFQIQKLKYLKNQQKKGDFENPKVQNHDFSTKLVPDQCGFPNSAVCWEPKYGTNRGPPVYAKYHDYKSKSLYVSVAYNQIWISKVRPKVNNLISIKCTHILVFLQLEDILNPSSKQALEANILLSTDL